MYDYLRQQMTNGNMQPGSTIEAKKVLITRSGGVGGYTGHLLARVAGIELLFLADVAAAVLFLAFNELSGHLSGEIVRVLGGKEGRVLFDPDEIKL